MGPKSSLLLAGVAASLCLAAPLAASVKDGVDAWSRGDYEAAVAEWQGPATQGDPDAQFNLAQAYRLGRGVPTDMDRAREMYRAAAANGHVKAADNYGMLLFQEGKREDAMPYIRDAADRGDPRAQYILGLAHFNADLAPKDWVRAYALMTLSHAAGLPQAASALTQMDSFIPTEQRQMAQSLAAEIKTASDARRTAVLAQADLAQPATPVEDATPRVPRRVATAPIAPSNASGPSYMPATAGADFVATPASSSATQTAPAPVPAVRQAAAGTGPWAIQLGAFGVPGNAEKLWSKLSGRPELAGAKKIFKPSGKVTVVLAGGFDSRDAAGTACQKLKASGQDCLVTRN
ncbi:SPOR domain-containing protein [Altererythrobacter arenosus]|uniref:SPOR domain-containing protein n=1 Tax=Altererythrobacter arenosus TaxID=3032592 RepID=A0ABY8FYA3_9SPHN|nr:SPOR domain-containing protein [Altererythrobacter sp. CAU 1644]WFL79008.1 SPOR domain-containing protein [Altererythrobacter sp. CAU 1644]